MRARGRRRRWWIPLAILASSAGALAWVWASGDLNRQANVVATLGVLCSTLFLLLIWAVAGSGLPWKARLGLLIALVAAGGLLPALVRIRGVSGDLVPILEWRFARGRDPLPLTPPSRGEPRPAAPPMAGKASWLEYPQFLGPERDAVVRGVRLAPDWSASPPRLVWRRPVGAGWSGFSAAGDAAFTQEQHGDVEVISSYGLLTGELRWTHGDPARYETVIGGVGPRATPTISGDRVYALGATGILNCLERSTGHRVWSRNIVEENGAIVNEWGMSGSPLVHEDLVIASAGGRDGRSLVAHDRRTGAPVWRGGSDRAGYSSPLLTTLAGVPQVLILNHASVASHAVDDGRVLWERPWSSANPNVAQPRPVPGDRVLVSSGYGIGSALFRVVKGPDGRLQAEEVWRTRSLKAKFANFVEKDGSVYGLDDGILACVDLETGERRWKSGRYGHGQIILAGDLLLVTTESGEVVLVEASPGTHRERARFRALDGKTWNSPALATPYLLIRNDQEAACYELPLAADGGR